MKSLLIDLRPMRIILYLFVIISILFSPAPGTEVVFEGIEVLNTLIIPVFSPILLMLLWLDSIIGKVWSTQTEGDEQKRYKMIYRTDLILSVIFIVNWFSYFSALAG